MFAYFPLGKALKKQIKTIKDHGEEQIKALAEHEKYLVNSSNKKDPETYLKQE